MTDEKVVGDLREYKTLNAEISRMAKQLKDLRISKTKIETRIRDYIHDKNLPGVKYENIVVLSTEKTSRKKLKKKEKEDNAMEVLQHMGILDPKDALAKILESMKGEKETVDAIQIKESKVDN
jgi:hypothetical protein